ncbi:MAG: APC family permease [bacterium]
MEEKKSLLKRMKEVVIGGSRNISDPAIFHNLSLIAFFAWVGLGADGLSSSCYGPEEAFITLGHYTYLGIFVAIASAITVFVISSSYSQIIELFPGGGGGYLVASKLLSPAAGVVSGSALIIDYVLTISLSVASGSDALFSFLPPEYQHFKLPFALVGLTILTIMNMRGVKESIAPLVPIFLIFIGTHVFIILFALIKNAGNFSMLAQNTSADIHSAGASLGGAGVIFLVLRAYSMGAGTYTGIEAVSNSLNVFREPRVINAKKTMRYMAFSLSFMVFGLILAYVLYHVSPAHGKTLNAVLFENATAGWPKQAADIFIIVTLVSEAALLFVAAQTGFIGGPGVLANMAKDKWAPSRFAALSDRLVAQNGIGLLGAAAFITVFLSKGSVKFLVVLYSINVFITFSLSQLGMVIHWWKVKKEEKKWFSKILVNGIGLAMTIFILVTVIIFKFLDGGWITIIITGSLIALFVFIRKHYLKTFDMLRNLDDLAYAALSAKHIGEVPINYDPNSRTAVVFVNGFNGLGMHTLMSVIRSFGPMFKNYIFVQIGIVDTGNFKGTEEVEKLKEHIKKQMDHYVNYIHNRGFYAEAVTTIGTDVMEESKAITAELLKKHRNSVFFGGQLVFEDESILTRQLHNYIVFRMQREFYQMGVTFVIMPVRVYQSKLEATE